MTKKPRIGRPRTHRVKIIVSLDPVVLEKIDQLAQARTQTRSQAIEHLIKTADPKLF